MDFFDSLISHTTEKINSLPSDIISYNSKNVQNDTGYSQVILQRDTAFELKGTGFNLITSANVNDEIQIIGPDLDRIKKDSPFARISIVQIDDLADEQKTYNLIRKIEYVKYHFFPEGYMLRTSSRAHKEAVRVSKKALKDGVDFERIGNLLISKYKEIPGVKAVKIIFITHEEAPFEDFEETARKSNTITETLNHIMNNVRFDCDSCNLKPICDEVEGMKELHFKNSSMMKGNYNE